uniref:RRM domain-containing protein n=1 Tax=Nelumbo nucifera TaxID=4432 RepID=A0A822Y1Z2_NELNU|nr:TPA_asm: hypothetical protein HUJ06_026783 [Nelumbo nucifera]
MIVDQLLGLWGLGGVFAMHDSLLNQPSQQLGGRRGEGQPSNILWIGYPPSVQVDEQMLHNAMILFGEIERIKSFPSRHYSFVEFRSVDEARRAKEGLQGRLFNDPRIQILFSSSELAPGKDSPAFYPGNKGARPDMFFNEPSFGPGTGDIFGHNRPITPSNFPGPLPPTAMPGPNMMRPFGPQGGFDSLHSGPEFNDLAGPLHNFPDPNPNNSMGPNWRRLSPPAPGMLPSPAPGMWPPIRPLPGTWDGFDTNPFEREAKRSRIDGPPIDDAPFSLRKMDNQGIIEQPYGFGPQLDTGTPLANVQIQGRHSPSGVRIPIGGPPDQGLLEKDYCWRGIIAKGGTPVCHARCIPIGKGINSQLPAVVNCSARTGLDMLAKHYSEASGFDIVFFLPDSEEDFASYTEFLRYLGSKNRAGVTKFDDGTTLFLVPPSDFLTKVLNILGPERLYGVVLKLPQQMPSSASIQQPQQPNPSSQYVAGQQFPPLQTDYGLTPQKEDHMLQMDYSRASHGDLVTQPSKALLPTTDESHLAQSVSQDYARNPATASQVGVSLTPELIATLAALLPTSMQPSASTNAQLPLGSSASRPSFPASVTPDKAIQSQGWRSDLHGVGTGAFQQSGEDQTSHPSQQLGHQFSAQSQLLSQFPAYANASNGPDHSAQAILGSTQNQGPALHMPQQGVSSSKPLSNFVIPSQGGQYTIPQQASQQYQLDSSHNLPKSYGMVQGTNISQAQAPTSLVTDNTDVEFPNQFQQLQSTLSGAGHGTLEGEADKNQRYQSTLQFAASLLLQIQQQQQQTNGQAVQGSGSHQ